MWKIINKWHRTFGIVSVIFVIILVITGVMLNHTDTLKLDHSFVQNRFLLDLYHIAPKTEPVGIQIDGAWITRLGERLYFNHIEISDEVEKFYGAIKLNDAIVVAFNHNLLLLAFNGEVIESLSGTEGVPSGMVKIGISKDKQPVIQAAHGFYSVDLDELEWHESDFMEADWSIPVQTPNKLNEVLLEQYRGKGLPLERVLLDLHSGRILGSAGVYIVDLMAILLMILAVSGTWMWFSR